MARSLGQREPEGGGRVFRWPPGPQASVVTGGGQRPGLDLVQVQAAAQVVDFVLDDTGRPPREHPVDGLAVLIERFDPDGTVAGYYPGEPWDAQAPFVEADRVVTDDRLERGVHQNGEF